MRGDFFGSNLDMGKEGENNKPEVKKEVQTLGMFEKRDPYVTVARELAKSGTQISFYYPVETPSFVSIATTKDGKETIDRAKAILLTSPEYRALKIAYDRGSDSNFPYIDDFNSLIWSLRNSDPYIFPEKIQRRIATSFLSDRQRVLTDRLNHTARDEKSPENAHVILGLKRMRKALKSRSLSQREQTELVKKIYFEYEVWERAVLTENGTEFPEVSQDTIGKIHSQVADNPEEFVTESLKIIKEQDRALYNYLVYFSSEISEDEEEPMFLGASIVHQALLREGICLPKVSEETINAYSGEISSASRMLRTLSEDEVWDEKTLQEKLKEHELDAIPHPSSRGEENPILMHYIAEKGITPGDGILNHFGRGAMLVYELKRRQCSEEQTRKKLQNFGQ